MLVGEVDDLLSRQLTGVQSRGTFVVTRREDEIRHTRVGYELFQFAQCGVDRFVVDELICQERLDELDRSLSCCLAHHDVMPAPATR